MSAFEKNGSFGCDRSAILVHQPPLPCSQRRTAVYALLDDISGRVVTHFGNSLPGLSQKVYHEFGAAACKHNDIETEPTDGFRTVIQAPKSSKISIFRKSCDILSPKRPPCCTIGSDADCARSQTSRPGRDGCPDCTGL